MPPQVSDEKDKMQFNIMSNISELYHTNKKNVRGGGQIPIHPAKPVSFV